MKTNNRTTTRIGATIIALTLASASFAQQADKPPIPGTYYSAKDFEWSPPWPFNPFPDLDVVEIAPGIYIFDDTAIPDTPEQAAARKRHEEAAALARAIAANPVLAKAAQEEQQAAQEAAWAKNREAFTPWLHQDIRATDGKILTLPDTRAMETAGLNALSEDLAIQAKENHQLVAEFLASSGFDPFTRLDDGGVSAIVRVENGLPRAVATCNLLAADTVGTDELWPGGNTGLSLTGTNIAIGLWDGGDVRISHREFSTNGVRVIDIDGPSIYGTNEEQTITLPTFQELWPLTASRIALAVWRIGDEFTQAITKTILRKCLARSRQMVFAFPIIPTPIRRVGALRALAEQFTWSGGETSW